MSRLSAVLYNVMFMQQVQTAGQMAALAAGHHELIVEVSSLFHHKQLYIWRLPRMIAVSCSLYQYCSVNYFYGAKNISWKAWCCFSAHVCVAPCRLCPLAMAYWCAQPLLRLELVLNPAWGRVCPLTKCQTFGSYFWHYRGPSPLVHERVQ